MNPCKCGNLGSHDQECSRAPKCALEYQSKISGPLLDRIDMHIEVSAVNPWDLAKVSNGEKSSSIRERVASARAFQANRITSYNVCYTKLLRKRDAEDKQSVEFTNVACRMLDLNNCRCKIYEHLV